MHTYIHICVYIQICVFPHTQGLWEYGPRNQVVRRPGRAGIGDKRTRSSRNQVLKEPGPKGTRSSKGIMP